jgi:tetratricopeptide (TPR) repeat protein
LYPLIREHFADELKQSHPDSFKEAHSRLYEHYSGKAPCQPDTLLEMAPLCHAVYHGCQSGRHAECLDKVYRDRIVRGDEFYLVRKLGSSGTDISLLANFFETLWSRPVAGLAPTAQAWTISRGGFVLRAVGRLVDAVELLSASADASMQLGQWEKVANAYSNLSQLYLTLANVSEAITIGRKSVTYAIRSGDAFEKILSYTALADALHQSGHRAEALRLFRKEKNKAALDRRREETLNLTSRSLDPSATSYPWRV